MRCPQGLVVEVPLGEGRSQVVGGGHREVFWTSHARRVWVAVGRIERMIETLAAGPGTEVDDLGPALLASIRSARTAEDAAAARQLELAARWADLHPPES